MVIKLYFATNSRGKCTYVETNILEMGGYQTNGTHSGLYKVTVGLRIQFELGDEAEAEH
jgi:hypothetical protein